MMKVTEFLAKETTLLSSLKKGPFVSAIDKKRPPPLWR
jgi:hypothetical protein